MDLPRFSYSGTVYGFPRRRGDGPTTVSGPYPRSGFPPQARGWTLVIESFGFERIVSPAGAGMDLFRFEDIDPPLGFPRRRGDGPEALDCLVYALQFPPQARGWTVRPAGR